MEEEQSDRAEVEMLRRLLLSWDGQWFLKVAARFGVDAAVELNAQVRTSFAKIEAREARKLRGRVEPLPSLEQALAFLAEYLRLGEPGSMQARTSGGGDSCTVTVQWCPAYAEAARAGLSRSDQACVACPGTWRSWIGGLTNKDGAEIAVEIPQRLSDGASECIIQIRGPQVVPS